MIAVLCIMAVILAVCFSLLLSSYQMFASVNDESQDERYYQQALTLDNVIADKITNLSYKTLTQNSIEIFAYNFINDSTQAYTDSQDYSFKGNKLAPDNYSNVELIFNKENKSVSDTVSTNTNGWMDTFIYYMILRENIYTTSSNNVQNTRASVATKYKITYGIDSYTYTASTINGTVLNLTRSGSNLTITDSENNSTTQTIDQLMLNKGAVKLSNGENVTVVRELKTNPKDYHFSIVGRV